MISRRRDIKTRRFANERIAEIVAAPEPDLYVPLNVALDNRASGHPDYCAQRLRAAAVPFPAAVPNDALGRLEAADLAAIENVFRLFEVGGGLLTNRERDARAKVLAALAGAPEGTDDGR